MTPLFTVQRIDTIRMFCDVPENDVPHLHIGDTAIVVPSGLDGKPFIGKVTRFSLCLDPETRNMRTEIDPAQPGGTALPGNVCDGLAGNEPPPGCTYGTGAGCRFGQ
jgi:hypothetical protein